MSDASTMTPATSLARGVPHIQPKRPEPKDWLIRECRSDPYAAAEEIAALMAAHATALDQISLLRLQIEELQGAKGARPQSKDCCSKTEADRKAAAARRAQPYR